MSERTYHEQSIIKYTKQLREIQEQLPAFTRQFFIAIDQTTAARTRVAYATDLKNQIILELLPFINELTGRRPIILPVIMEVNRKED